MNFHIRQNAISNFALNIGVDISDKYYSAISTIDKNLESGYYIVKRIIDIYTLESSNTLGKYFIETDELVCDAVYLNLFTNFKKWCNRYEK